MKKIGRSMKEVSLKSTIRLYLIGCFIVAQLFRAYQMLKEHFSPLNAENRIINMKEARVQQVCLQMEIVLEMPCNVRNHGFPQIPFLYYLNCYNFLQKNFFSLLKFGVFFRLHWFSFSQKSSTPLLFIPQLGGEMRSCLSQEY